MMYRYGYSLKYRFIIILIVALGGVFFELWQKNPILTLVISLSSIFVIVFIRKILIEKSYKDSILEVNKQFVLGRDTIANTHCTVKVFPNNKLIVMENIPDSQNKKSMFTITSKEKYKVNKCWSNVCRVFDFDSNVFALAFLLDVPKDKIIRIESTVKQNTLPESKQINIDNSKVGPKFDGVIDFSAAVALNSTGSKGANVVKSHDLSSPVHNVDVNSATADEIAVLPGINIVQAKKIVESRDKYGLFNSEEDFFNRANIKDFFVEKLRPMIIIRKDTQHPENNDGEEQSRIVDF
mgnify:CR=1 FL=1